MKTFTLMDFLLYHTQCYELCVIRDQGWIIFTVWIDNEDIFKIPEGYSNKQVLDDRFGTLPITNEDGERQYINVHYIDI